MLDVMKLRHSVRQYEGKPIEKEKRDIINTRIAEINGVGNLHIQVVYDDPQCFVGLLARYGKFDGVVNYIALVGNRFLNPEENLGYFGEELVLKVQELGLNTCWVGSSYKKKNAKVTVERNEKLYGVIALGYGTNQGYRHKVKTLDQVSNYSIDKPMWFKNGVEAALLAPTAMNRQRFFFKYRDGDVKLAVGRGSYAAIDKGIVRYHFEKIASVFVKNNY